MNFMDATLEDKAGKTWFNHPNFSIAVTPEQRKLLSTQNSKHVRMGVRPDALGISGAKPKDGHIQGEIFVTELLGSDMIVDVNLEDSRIRVKTTPEFMGKEGEKCYITVNRDKWHAFSMADGQAFF